MKRDFTENDYSEVRDLLNYPEKLKKRLGSIKDTSDVKIPDDPIEKVVFQDRAKDAIRKVAQNKGHILMVGKPGTGKSLLANMFNEVIDKSIGEFIKPKDSIVAYPGKDQNHMKIAYARPEKIDKQISELTSKVDEMQHCIDKFSLKDEIKTVKR